jgi:NADPH:quinone reductase-like Zn-dependent oxidoreductase
VVATESSVSGLLPGDEIYGVTNSRFIGAYAEYAVAAASMVALKPTSLTYIEAASVPVVAVTAWQALFDHAQLQRGETVLIHGAAGNVGAYAVQFARRAGLRIIATGAAKDLEFLRRLGAETLVNYEADRFEEMARGVDAVIDLVGGETQVRSFAVLRKGGKLISTVSQPDPHLAHSHDVAAKFFLVEVTRSYLDQIGKLLDDGSVRPRLGAVVPFGEARESHLMLEGKLPRPEGKIVLAVPAGAPPI